MSCNCNCNKEENTIIQIIRNTSVFLTFEFNTDISDYPAAQFTIRKNYQTEPVINKTITGFSGTSMNVELTPDETNLFTEFLNGKNSAQYIWGLDLIDNDNNVIINVFPQLGESAPICIVYRNVVEV